VLIRLTQAYDFFDFHKRFLSALQNLFQASISCSLVECISAKELHTQAPTALDIDKIKYSPQAYPISGTSPHCGQGFKSSIATSFASPHFSGLL
jgi:hypothetical protein